MRMSPGPDHDRALSRRGFIAGAAAGGALAGVGGIRPALAQEPSPEPSASSTGPSNDGSFDNLYVRGPRPWRDVVAFGADASGSTDSTVAIQAALDMAGEDGGVVLVPGGTYLVSARLVVPGGVWLTGSGAASVIKASNNHGLLRTGGGRAVISDLRLDGNDPVAIQRDAVAVLHSHCRVENVEVVSWGRWAVGVYSTTRKPGDYSDDEIGQAESTVTGVAVTGCRFVAGDKSVQDGAPNQHANQGGVYLGPGVVDFRVESMHLEAATGPSSTGSYSGVRADSAQRGLITGCFVDGRGRTFDGLVSWGARSLTIEGNTVVRPHDDGATYVDNGAAEPSEDVVIASNHFIDCGTSGVLCPGGGPHRRITIVGNTVNGTGLAGIRFGGAIHSSCIGNVIKNAAQYGIDVLGAGGGNSNVTKDSVVSGNTIESPGWSGIHLANGGERNVVSGNVVRSAGTASATNARGILVQAVDSLVEGNVVADCVGEGILVNTAATFSVISGNKVIRNKIGIYLPPGVTDALVTGNSVRLNREVGIDVYGDGARNQITSNSVIGNNQTGIRCLMQTDGVIESNLVMRNGVSSGGSGNTHGIRLYNSQRMLVTGNKVGDDQSTPTQVPQIREDGSSDNNTISGNDLTPGPRPLEVVGAATVARNNKGYVKENQGTVTLPLGAASINVDHGLSATPALRDISLTPTNNLGATATYWVSNPTATRFTINVSGIAKNLAPAFAWRVALL